jgi:ribosome maturation factor RimP
MTVLDRLRGAIEPLLDDLDLGLYDLERTHDALRVTVESAGAEPVDSSRLTKATRAVSVLLDTLDPFPGRYTLEVSTPGLERALRTPAHFAGAVGEQVSIRTRPGTEGDRRAHGSLLGADDEGVTVLVDDEPRRVAYDDIERARTVVDWSKPPKPGHPTADDDASDGGRGGRTDRRKART